MRRRILRQTDEDIIEQDQLIKKEIEDGIIPDPSIPVDPMTGMPMETGGELLGQVPKEPDMESQAKVVEIPKGGEI